MTWESDTIHAAGNEEIVLPLSDVAHLFNAPRVDPLSRSPAQIFGISGVDYLLAQLSPDRTKPAPQRLVLELPTDEVNEHEIERVRMGLRRLAQCRIDEKKKELRTTYRYGARVAGIAVLILAICIAISTLFRSEMTEGVRPLIRTTLEYGFEIIGWVILWHPVDVLVFVPVGIRGQIRALKNLERMEVVFRAVHKST
jgi:hypothetical protein